jgi:Ca2+-binding RTX toxin-like protein
VNQDTGQDSIFAAPQAPETIYIDDQGNPYTISYATAAPQDSGTVYINDQGQEVFLSLGIDSQAVVTSFQLAAPLEIDRLQISQLVVGTSASDNINGSNEGDALSGGNGKDRLTGGGGADAFVFNATGEYGKKSADLITDFDSDDGDKVVISSDAFEGISKVKLAVVTGKNEARRASQAGRNVVYDEKKGMLYYDANGKKNGWGEGGEFAQLLGSPDISKGDFLIIQ